MKKKKIIKSISFRNLTTLEEARKRAKALGLSFSSYVALPIEGDLEDRNDLVIREKDSEDDPEAEKKDDEANE